ncbi:hypothetical protein NP493_2g01053 [Ridgeia piscesae]|uniref:Uncharacterized protein n=1 Tax=Ridgeia piscesae TaxID=27915 RepID=A0AAD9PGF1_RIDPI|nr:hypothetical protein NP493_2g01053 [Ridgeia piscesae]
MGDQFVCGQFICRAKQTARKTNVYEGDLSEAELEGMRFSAQLCRKNNEQVIRSCGSASISERTRWRNNSSFLIKSENARLYTGGLRTRIPLDLYPSGYCPNAERHVFLIQDTPLCVACPTCWSVQRIPAISSKVTTGGLNDAKK